MAIPLGNFVAVTGVSGSGKSTLVSDILYPVADAADLPVEGRARPAQAHRGLEHLDKVIDIDQSPIGRTPRSNPATYTGVFDHIRKLFAATQRGQGARLPARAVQLQRQGRPLRGVQGDGTIKIEMHFLPDVYVPCEVCKGARYNRDTLDIKFKGKNIAEVLDMPRRGGARVLRQPAGDRPPHADAGRRRPRLRPPRPAGADALRRRGAAGQARHRAGQAVDRAHIYILDEPTTGLHFEDVRRCSRCCHRLVDQGNTVLVIEHNLDVIKTADWIIDLGPEGGRSDCSSSSAPWRPSRRLGMVSIPEGEVVAGEERIRAFADRVPRRRGPRQRDRRRRRGRPLRVVPHLPGAVLEEEEIPVGRPLGAPYITTDDPEPKDGAAVGVASVSADGALDGGGRSGARDAHRGLHPVRPAFEQSLVGATAENTNGTDIAVDDAGTTHVVWSE